MNKYIESDIKDWLNLLKIGKEFDTKIEFINSSNKTTIFYVDDIQIYINQLDDHCSFYNYPIFKC